MEHPEFLEGVLSRESGHNQVDQPEPKEGGWKMRQWTVLYVAASRDDTHPSALRVTAKFNVNTPWAFQLAETRLLEYIRGYLARYANLLVRATCS